MCRLHAFMLIVVTMKIPGLVVQAVFKHLHLFSSSPLLIYVDWVESLSQLYRAVFEN